MEPMQVDVVEENQNIEEEQNYIIENVSIVSNVKEKAKSHLITKAKFD